jgi:hypothetical protein
MHMKNHQIIWQTPTINYNKTLTRYQYSYINYINGQLRNEPKKKLQYPRANNLKNSFKIIRTPE